MKQLQTVFHIKPVIQNWNSIMKKNLLLLLCLLASLGYAQSFPKTIFGDLGGWHGPVEDYYGRVSPRRSVHAGIGVGLDWVATRHIALSTELSLEYFDFRNEYGSPKDLREVESNLGLFYGRFSPGIRLQPTKHFEIRTGFGLMASALTIGSYSMWFVDQNINQIITIDYENHFSRIRSPFVVGPELALLLRLPQEDEEVVKFGVTGFAGLNSIFKPGFSTPYNPRIFRIGLLLAYTFPP